MFDSQHSEQQILGAIVVQPESYWKIAELDPEFFAVAKHREYFIAVRDMLMAGDAVDLITVSDRLGGKSLSELGNYANQVASIANITTHAKIVRESALKRSAQQNLTKAIKRLANNDDYNEVIGELLPSLDQPQGKSDKAISQVLSDAMIEIERVQGMADKDIIGIDTTIPKLNALTKGFHGGKLITLGGRPGTYKSTYALQVAVRNALKQIPVGIISLEMLSAEIGTRIMSQVFRVNGSDLSAGHKETVEKVYAEDLSSIRNSKLFVDDRAQTLPEIISRIVEWKKKHDMQLVIIDYLQLIKITGRSKREEIGDITRQLKLLAMRLKMPIMILSQLNRELEKQNRQPFLSDLRDSGDIEQDSDMVIFTHREKAGSSADSDKYELILAKQRNGASGKVIPLAINGSTFSVFEADQFYRGVE